MLRALRTHPILRMSQATREYYHGHVPNPAEIPQRVITMLRRAGLIDKKYNVLPEPAPE